MFVWLQVEETPVMDVIESVTPVIVKRYLSTLSFKERVSFSSDESLTCTLTVHVHTLGVW